MTNRFVASRVEYNKHNLDCHIHCAGVPAPESRLNNTQFCCNESANWRLFYHIIVHVVCIFGRVIFILLMLLLLLRLLLCSHVILLLWFQTPAYPISLPPFAPSVAYHQLLMMIMMKLIKNHVPYVLGMVEDVTLLVIETNSTFHRIIQSTASFFIYACAGFGGINSQYVQNANKETGKKRKKENMHFERYIEYQNIK